MDRPLSEALVTFSLLVFAAFMAMAAYSWHESWMCFSEKCSLSSYAEQITLAIYEAALESKLSSHNVSIPLDLKDYLVIRGEGDHFTIASSGYSVRVILENFSFFGAASGHRVNITCTPRLEVVFSGGLNGSRP